jgi:hypothetical protein
MARKPTDTVQLKLRFSEGLRRRLVLEARANERSMNAEIIQRLESSFRRQDATRDAEKYRKALAELGVKISDQIREQERRYTGLLKPFLKAQAEQPNKGAQDTSEQPLTDKEEDSK